MDLKQYRNKLIGNEDERAVSPVIGVILMVAITVILAAVIAAFVLDIGDLDDSAPNAQFDWETIEDPENEDEEIVSVTHTSGDDIDISNLEFESDDPIDDEDREGDVNADDEEWTAGQSMHFEEDNDDFQITWTSDGSSTILTEYDG